MCPRFVPAWYETPCFVQLNCETRRRIAFGHSLNLTEFSRCGQARTPPTGKAGAVLCSLAEGKNSQASAVRSLLSGT